MNNEYENKLDGKAVIRTEEDDHRDNLELSENPDENVGDDGDCMLPPHAESARMNTGAPCDDGRLKK